MKALLPISVVLCTTLVQGGALELRKVVAPGEGKLVVVQPNTGRKLTLADTVIVTEKDVKLALLVGDESRNEVALTLKEAGAKRMADVTRNNKGNLQIAILIDGKLHLAQVVHSQLSKHIAISGFKDHAEAERFARRFTLGAE